MLETAQTGLAQATHPAGRRNATEGAPYGAGAYAMPTSFFTLPYQWLNMPSLTR